MKRVGLISEAAVARDGSDRDGLYFPVNSEDATAQPATAACEQRCPGPRRRLYFPVNFRNQAICPGDPGDGRPNRDGLYFSVNSRDEAVGAGVGRSLRIPAGAQGTNPDRHCKSLQIVADTHAAAVGPSSGIASFLLREIAAAA
jgi:hypothetical protein